MQEKFTKIILIVSMVFLLCSATAFFLFRSVIIGKSKILEEGQAAWQAEAIRREEIKVLDQTLRGIQEERAKLETHFVRSSDAVSLLDTLETLATSVSAKAEISSVDVAKDGTHLLVGVRASGTFAALYKFLTLLENSPYEISFGLVDFRKSLEESTAPLPQWGATFQLRVLSFLP